MLLEAAGFSEEDLAAAAETGICAGSQNDMIFSIICEELGLTGAFFLIGIFGLLMWRLMVIALHCRELQGTLLCVGIMSHMAIQVILNIAVVTNTIPIQESRFPLSAMAEPQWCFFWARWGWL